MILAAAQIDTGDTAWLLAATALVLLMTPGLALFYGGMVRTKSVLNMLMMSFVSIALVTVVWLAAGYSLAFGDDAFGGLIGGWITPEWPVSGRTVSREPSPPFSSPPSS